MRYDLARLALLVSGRDLLDRDERFGRPRWYREAACRDHPEVSFHPERGQILEVATAKQICSQCPVRRDCARVGWNEQAGIWRGTSGRDRRRAQQRGYTVDELLDELDSCSGFRTAS